MCSVPGGEAFNVFSRTREAADGVPLTPRTSWMPRETRRSFMNLFLASCGCWSASSALRYRGVGEQKDQRAFWVEPQGMRQAPLRVLSVCFPLRFSFSHLALRVLTLRLSGVLLLACPHTLSLKTHLAKPPHPLGDLTDSQLLHSNAIFSGATLWKTHCRKPVGGRASPTDLKRPLMWKSSPGFVVYSLCSVGWPNTGGQCPVTAAARPCQLMILGAMARPPVSESAVTVREVLWQPSWFRVHRRRHQQLWDDTALAAPASYTPSLASIFAALAETDRGRDGGLIRQRGKEGLREGGIQISPGTSARRCVSCHCVLENNAYFIFRVIICFCVLEKIKDIVSSINKYGCVYCLMQCSEAKQDIKIVFISL